MNKIIYITLLVCFGATLVAQSTGTPAAEKPLELLFTPQGGFYEQSLDVRLISPEATIYYTTDGSTPSTRSAVYKSPIRVNATTIIRAIAINGDRKSLFKGQTYFLNEPATQFPVVSIGITPAILFDPYRGLFMQGSNALDTLWHKPGANFWSRKEVPVQIDMFESDGKLLYSSLTGLRLFGGMSRLFPQKSLALVARKRYGESRFDHPFGKEGPKDPKFLVLRNSGSDFGKSHFRDALMTSLVDDCDLDRQAYRPAHVYINGKYWGIYNIREKINRYFIADHHDVHRDSIDFIEHKLTLRRGSTRHYQRLLSYLDKNDLRDPKQYTFVQTQMEVDNFMNYQIAEIFFDNQDAGGNIKYWRPKTPAGRWRWILYDTDWGFGLQEKHAYRNNSLAFHTEPNGPYWPNPPWSTFILRRLLTNPDFRAAFVNRFADQLNYGFATDRVLDRIDQFYYELLPEMPRHLKRWNLSQSKWQEQIDILRTFAQERPRYVRMHLMEKFNTGAQRTVNAVATPGGTILINNFVHIRDAAFQGVYFEHYPITIKAIPDYGYRFVGWEGIEMGENQREFTLQLKEKRYAIRAIFEPFHHPLVDQVMINEICASNKHTGDWVELYNHSNEKVSLKGWILTDNKNEFILPDVSMDPRDYLIICREPEKFISVFPQAYNVISGLSFGINKRHETLALYSAEGASVDSTGFLAPAMDTTFTVSLLLPSLDNSNPGNWELRQGLGTPNLPNPHYAESSIRIAQEQWMQIGVAAGVFILCILLLFLRNKGIL